MNKTLLFAVGISACIFAGCTAKVTTDTQVNVQATTTPEPTQMPESSPQSMMERSPEATPASNKDDTPDLMIKDLNSTSIQTESFN